MVALVSTFSRNLHTDSIVAQLVYGLTSSVYWPFSPHVMASICHCFFGDICSENSEMESQAVLICISLMTKNIEHISHILIGLLFFLELVL